MRFWRHRILQHLKNKNMSREIKFRAWYKVDKQMVNHKSRLSISLDGLPFYKDDQSTATRQYVQDNFILMQFTGLKDKNGNEIYEGDIVKTSHAIIPIGVIKYWDVYHSFEIEKGNECIGDKYDWSDLEVIGNIHQHPELLTDKK